MVNIKQAEQSDIDALFHALSLLESSEEVAKLFEDLCTPAEISAMADRWRAVQEIKNDKSYRQIYAETGVSVTTVARIARCITHGAGGYNLMYDKVESAKEKSK
ncbi:MULTISPECIES: YerC/YecD family TrpR-related protein [Cysteiniphilum]|uniref:DNA-binding transcriptional regulator n=1 Tax=Cysteiniphilum litorale TaxID=2056700 RepID=A0A8J2Z3J6_9GAMM|nr:MULTISPECIES: YerC/YecD family TrpR-related protein [Cysteiniphilum]GGF94851.1 DNA-binding transcriptional regulator [Cysteiniphilum litorale]